MDQKIKLKPCPFCGGKAKIHTGKEFFLIYEEECSNVFCENCQATSRYRKTPKEVIDDWNRRTDNGTKMQ